ncbi:hypothetical protein HK097_001173, partial [Rhizophlyctis rosea]
MMDVQGTYPSAAQLLAAAASHAVDIPHSFHTAHYTRTQSLTPYSNLLARYNSHVQQPRYASATASTLDASAKHSTTAPTPSNLSARMATSPTSQPSSPCTHRQCHHHHHHSSSDTIRIAKQNRKRLQLLRNSVMQSPSGFLQGCDELRVWCNDRRAYLPELASELDQTLKFVAEKAIVENYNLDAGIMVMDIVQKWKANMVPAAADNLYQYIKFLLLHQQARINQLITTRNYYAPTP